MVLVAGLHPGRPAQTMKAGGRVMANLIPPMDDEAPPEFLAFVAARLDMLRSEAGRLTGGARSADEVAMEVLADLAGHWRGLTVLGRLLHRNLAGEYLDRRLTARTRQWREDQVYPVEVTVLRDTTWDPPRRVMEQPQREPEPAETRYQRPVETRSEPPDVPAEESLARQLALYLPSTVRRDVAAVAEAEIAWVHAYRRYVWRRYCRIGGGYVLLIGGMVQFMSQVSAPG